MIRRDHALPTDPPLIPAPDSGLGETLTAIVTTHREGRLLRPTLRSVEAGLVQVIAAGYRAELLIVCDTPDDRTRHEVQHWLAAELPFPVRVLEVEFGESGASRNAGVSEARGEFISFVDGDDLISADYFTGAIGKLCATHQPTVIHPEYVISFGARSAIWRIESASVHGVNYRDLMRQNLWPSSAVTRRAVYLAHPYRSLPPGGGYGPEDWIWNIDTSAAGIIHEAAEGTVFFYRVRDRGGVNNGHAVSILPPFDLEGLKSHLPVRDTETDASPVRLAHRVYRSLLPAARWITSPFSFEVKHRIYLAARYALRRVSGRPSEPAYSALIGSLREAAVLEPAISNTAARISSVENWIARDDGYAEVLEEAITAIGDRSDALVFVPWLGVGGADMVSLNYARALQSINQYSGRTTMVGTYDESRTKNDLVPDALNYVHLNRKWLGLPTAVRHRLIAQLIVMMRPKVVVSVNCFHLTESLHDHAKPITDGTKVFATLFAFDRIGAGYPTNPITDDGQRQYLDDISGVITDNTSTARLIDQILALPVDRILVHRQPALDDVPALDRTMRAFDNRGYSKERPFRLVWPHRIDVEKRPDVVIAIADRFSSAGLPVTIESWGQAVMHGDPAHMVSEMKRAGIVHRGAYQGGLPALPLHEYDALLLTSQSEGLPLALVQAMLLGLPVVASAVGGVTDIVHDGVTGLTADGPDDIEGFVDAVSRLMESPALRRRLAEDAYAFATARHSWDQFDRAVVEMLQ